MSGAVLEPQLDYLHCVVGRHEHPGFLLELMTVVHITRVTGSVVRPVAAALSG